MKKEMSLLLVLVMMSAGCASMDRDLEESKVHIVDLGDGVTMEFMPIPAGSFMMGSDNLFDDRMPVHQVTLSKSFWMANTEVTQAQWKQIMGSNPSEFMGDDLPVEQVSWNDAASFCTKLTEIERQAGRLPEGYAYTLPTEAHWEYACRAGTTVDYEGDLDAMGWYEDNSGYETHPVGTKQANAWGLYDMHGNVWEWCSDWYGDYPSGNVVDPGGPPSGSRRVFRGDGVMRSGEWYVFGTDYRLASRGRYDPSNRYDFLGFRVCLSDVSRIEKELAEESRRAAEEYENARVKQNSIMDSMGIKTNNLGNGITMEFMPIPAGSFMMGSENKDDEKPVHQVTISKPFWMAETEVTQAQWKQVMGSNPSHFEGDDLPVELVNWEDATAFCNKLTEIERQAGRLPAGFEYTLPTEAQWEYACRAGTTGDYATSTGSGQAGNLDSMAWYSENSERKTHPVGTKEANAWGLYDMHGNVWEWCLDWNGDYPSGSVVDPGGPSSGSSRVIRGGGLGIGASNCRSAYRINVSPDSAESSLGFRPLVLQR